MRAVAYVNHGRWVAECATEDCAVAHLVEPSDRFQCEECGLSYRVTWPLCKTQIDRALDRRPVPRTRNWYPNETVTDLHEENKAHGVDST